MNGSLRNLSYKYIRDGFDEDGEMIPDIPIVYLSLESKYGRATGPAIIDTGFDGGIYSNLQVIRILEGLEPIRIKRIENPLYEPVICEIFRVQGFLIKPTTKQVISLGSVNVYVPTEPDFIGDEVLVGRELINNLELKLDGKKVSIKLSENLEER